MVVTPLAGCTPAAGPAPPSGSTPPAAAVSASASPPSVASAEPTGPAALSPWPFLPDGCPPGRHDVRQWRRIDPAAVTVDQRYSLNYSQCSWDVSIRDGVAGAEAHPDTRPAIPPGLRVPDRWGPPRVIKRGRSGFLVGFNHGEWGGALRWYSESGPLKRELLDDNVVDLLQVPAGFIAFTGLAHLGSDDGRATEIIDTGTLFRLGRSVDLGSAPRAVLLEGDGAVLVVTMAGISRISPSFQVTGLLSTRWGSFYPVSLAREGTIAYVGMRGVVAEVDLAADTPTETWLSPADLK